MTGLLEERKTMTLEEFLALPEQDEQGNHFELDEGELIPYPQLDTRMAGA